MELYIDAGKSETNKAMFDALEAERDDIEHEVGAELSWERLNDARSSRVAWYTTGSIDYSAESLQELSDWAIESLLKFRNVFQKRIRRLT